MAATIAERDYEAKWLCTMGRLLDLGMDTVGLAVGMMDRILSTAVVKSK